MLVETEIERAAQGNFLYARVAVDEMLATGKTPNLALPAGLQEHYTHAVRETTSGRPAQSVNLGRSLLATLAVSIGDGLTIDHLAGIVGVPRPSVSEALLPWSQFLVGMPPNGPFRLFHPAFRECLLHIPDLDISPPEAHRAVGEHFLEEYRDAWEEADDYALRTTPLHLTRGLAIPGSRLERERVSRELHTLITDLDFLEAKAQRLGIEPVIADLDAASRAFTKGSVQARESSALLKVLSRYKGELGEWEPRDDPHRLARLILHREEDLDKSLGEQARRILGM